MEECYLFNCHKRSSSIILKGCLWLRKSSRRDCFCKIESYDLVFEAISSTFCLYYKDNWGKYDSHKISIFSCTCLFLSANKDDIFRNLFMFENESSVLETYKKSGLG